MAWIESHQQLERHPKTHELMGLMGWDLDTTIGKLHRFWWWCLDYAPTGDLRGKNDAVLAASVGVASADGKRFVDAMVKSRWIDRADGTLRVHDWTDYAGRYLRESKFRRHADKLKELDDLYGDSEQETQDFERPRTVRGLSALPDQPDLTKPTRSPPGPPAGGDVDLFGGKSRERGRSRSKPKPAEMPPLPPSLRTPRFEAAWAKWVAFRSELKPRCAVTPTMAEAQLGRLAKEGEAAAVARIERTIANGWRGLWPTGEAEPPPAAPANGAPRRNLRTIVNGET